MADYNDDKDDITDSDSDDVGKNDGNGRSDPKEEFGVIGGEFATSKSKVMINFIWMTVGFSVNHGVATTLIALASSEFEQSLASWSLGVLYGFYTFTALLLSTAVVQKIGPKYSLCVGVFGYCFYISTFLVASVTKGNTRIALVLIGSAISGIGAGLLWTAQGQYFESSARLYAVLSGKPKKEVSGLLAGIFTGMYMGLEFLLKLLSSLVELETHKEAVFGLFLTIAFASSFLMLFVRNIRPKLAENEAMGTVTTKLFADKAMAAINLLRKDKNAVLLAPYNFAFGFSGTMLQLYANKSIVTDQLQPADSKRSYVGFAAAIAISSGAIASLFFGFLTKKIGKTFPMVLGNLCFLVMAISFAFIPENVLGQWALVAPLYVTFGVGRGIWESVNRAIYGDFFPDDTAAGFANITMLSGFSSFIAFFIFPLFSKEVMAYFIIVSSVLGVVGFLIASHRFKQRGDPPSPVGEEVRKLLDTDNGSSSHLSSIEA